MIDYPRNKERIMDTQVEEYIKNYPEKIARMFYSLRCAVLESALPEPAEVMWAKLPSYYAGESFVRLIPFQDHINIEAKALALHMDELAGYRLTPKGMLQIYINQEIPAALKRIFAQTLADRSL